MKKPQGRIYICHTFYHAYIACLKELNMDKDKWGQASLMLSSMSNDFGNLKERAEKSGLFKEVIPFDEKEIVSEILKSGRIPWKNCHCEK